MMRILHNKVTLMSVTAVADEVTEARIVKRETRYRESNGTLIEPCNKVYKTPTHINIMSVETKMKEVERVVSLLN
jgi:hypothetical protein